MAKPIQIPIISTFNAAGVNAATKAIQQLATAARSAASSMAPLATAASQAQAASGRVAAGSQQAASAIKQQGAAAASTDAQILKLANAQARLAMAQGDAAGAARILAQALAQVDTSSAAAISTQTRLVQIQDRLASGASEAAGKLQVLPRTIAGLSNEAKSFAQSVASGFAIGQVVQFGQAAIDSANKLEDAKGALRGLAGDAQTYAAVIAKAEENQRLFGGSLADSISDFSSFIISSRSAGVSLDKITDAAKRLAAFDPGQGLQGANVALRELLSGNANSLAMRFELPKSALKALGDESLSAGEKLDALGAYFDSIGLTSEALTARLDNNSQKYRDLSAATEQLTTNLGTALATGLAPFAEGLAKIAQTSADAIGKLNSTGEQLASAGAAAYEGAAGYDEYAARVAFVNDQLTVAEGQIGNFSAAIVHGGQLLEPLTEAQYNFAQSLQTSGMAAAEAQSAAAGLSSAQIAYAQSLIASGTAAATAVEQTRALGPAIDGVGAAMSRLGTNYAFTTAQMAALKTEMDALTAAGPSAAAGVVALTGAFNAGLISAEELQAGLAFLTTTTNEEAAAALVAASADTDRAEAAAFAASMSSEATLAAQEKATALTDETVASQSASIEAEILAIRQEELMLAAQGAAAGSASLEAAASAMASQFGISYGEALRLIGALRQLAALGGGPAGGAAKGATGGALAGVGRSGPGARRGPNTNLGEIAGGVVDDRKPARKPKGAGGGGGGKAKVNEAQQIADKLAQIAQQSGEKIAEINEQTARKLVDIDRKAAAERAAIAQQLANTIAQSTAAATAAAEANDLELVGVEDEAQKAKLAAREKAEAEGLARQAAINEQTKQMIADGQAEQADEYYKAQSESNQRRQQLDQQYYERQAELAGNPEALAELDKQYAEAVAAAEAQAAIEQQIAEAKAAAKIAAVQEEKAQVIAAAEEQKAEVVARAAEQAEGVKGASAGQRAAVVGDLQAQASAATDWASATSAAAAEVEAAAARAAAAINSIPSMPAGGAGDSGAGGGGGGQTAAAGGGTFVTSGPTTLTVGDNPGGAELVQVTPISGKGQTRVGGNMAQLAGGGTVVARGATPGASMRAAAGGDARRGGLPDTSGTLNAIQRLAGTLEGVAQVSKRAEEAAEEAAEAEGQTAEAIGAMTESGASVAAQANSLADILNAAAAATTESAEAAEDVASETAALSETTEEAVEAAGRAADLIDTMNVITISTMGRPNPPIPLAYVQTLAEEARRVTDLVARTLIPVSEQGVEAFGRYVDLTADSVDLVTNLLDIGTRVQGRIPPPVEARYIQALADEAQRVAQLVAGVLLPVSERDGEMLSRYVATVADNIDILLGVNELATRIQGRIPPPINVDYLKKLAAESQEIGRIVGGQLLPISERDLEMSARYASANSDNVNILTSLADLRERLGNPKPAISLAYVTALAKEAQAVGQIVGSTLLPISERDSEMSARYASANADNVDILSSIADLAERLGKPVPPIDMLYVRSLALQAQAVGQIVGNTLIPISEENAAALERYASVVSASVDILSGVAGLAQDLAEPVPPISLAVIFRLAEEARAVAQVVQGQLLPTTEEQADALDRYASAAGSAVDVLSGMASLAADLTEPTPPINVAVVRRLADEAKQVTQIVRGQLLPTSEEQAAALDSYASSAGSAVDIIAGVADLGRNLAEASAPISMATVQRLADDAQRITQVVQGRLLPISEDQAEALDNYSSAVSSSADALSSVLDLSGALFADYISPTDAQLNQLAIDAQRVTEAFAKAGQTIEQSQAGQAYADALQATFAAGKEGLLLFDALNSGSFALDPAKLAQFETATLQTLAVMTRIGAAAQAVPADATAALGRTAAAMQSQASALVTLAAVPFDNLPSAAAGFAGAAGGGGGGSVTNLNIAPGAIVINAAPGVNTDRIAQQVISRIEQQYKGRR